MKKNFLLAIFLTSVFSELKAQLPADKLTDWGLKNPIEKIYLHCDREDYVAGQTVWFKAYLTLENQPNDKVSTLFVELLNRTSGQVSRKIFPVIAGISQGQLELPDTLSSGNYIIRAYSATMLNQDARFVYKKNIAVTGKEIKNSALADKKIVMYFFPEGGNFVAGKENTIAFKITDQNGLPVNMDGEIKNAGNETIVEFSCYYDGMGMIDLVPTEKETYYAVLKNDASGQKYFLPPVASKGIVFRLMNGDDGIHFEVTQQKADPVFEAAYMIGQMQHHVVFKQPLKAGVVALSGIIKTNNLSSGILHITIFNKEGMPLAERLSFIDNKEYQQSAELLTDTIDFSSHGKNHFTLAFKDTVVGNFSVSITDPLFNAKAEREENILSSLLLTSDLKGHIHNPAWYFSSGSDSAKYALDMVMMINGWRRFKWEQLLKDSMPAANYKDPGFITISGRVTLEGTKKPFADKDMLLFIVAADSSRNMQMIKTDANGYYNADSVIFFGPANILMSDIRGRKSRFVDIKPGADSLSKFYFLPLMYTKNLLQYDKPGLSKDDMGKRLAGEYEAFKNMNGLVLKEVVIKSRKKSALDEVEEKYTSGAFSGDSRKTFDLVNTDDAASYTNIFDFLQARVPGLVAGRGDDGDYFVYFRQMATISSLGNQSMDVFVDEVRSDASSVAFIPPSQIALVKVYSNFVGATGGGAGGVLAIYLKKGTDYFKSIPSAGETLKYNGYSIIKEFYTPDYSVPLKQTQPDRRMTLQWKPDVYVAGVNSRIPITFYNNDRTTHFKIVVEGMTADGKLLMIEKTIQGKGF